jgi:DNA polymerase III subunit chi
VAEVLFYQLTSRTLEQVLPGLLERCLERDWRVVVQSGSLERLQSLDAHLWTYRDESFLPHSMVRDETQGEQPVWLTTEEDNPNGAAVRFLIDGARSADLGSYSRVIYLFDGHDIDSLEGARERWKAEKSAGHEVTYWQQDESGRWHKKG